MSHNSDYGISDDAEAEYVIGMRALRTFRIQGEQLYPVTSSISGWKDGTCTAVCTSHSDDEEHEVPAPNCTCGIYGALTLDVLLDQWEDLTMGMVAVIAPEGATYVGTKGLRTAAARVVAYCTPHQNIRNICERQCPGARGYYDIDVMLAIHGFPPAD